MSPEPPPRSAGILAVLILGGGGLGLVAVGVTTTWGWTLFVPGFIALLVAVPVLWIIQRSRERRPR